MFSVYTLDLCACVWCRCRLFTEKLNLWSSSLAVTHESRLRFRFQMMCAYCLLSSVYTLDLCPGVPGVPVYPAEMDHDHQLSRAQDTEPVCDS